MESSVSSIEPDILINVSRLSFLLNGSKRERSGTLVSAKGGWLKLVLFEHPVIAALEARPPEANNICRLFKPYAKRSFNMLEPCVLGNCVNIASVGGL